MGASGWVTGWCGHMSVWTSDNPRTGWQMDSLKSIEFLGRSWKVGVGSEQKGIIRTEMLSVRAQCSSKLHSSHHSPSPNLVLRKENYQITKGENKHPKSEHSIFLITQCSSYPLFHSVPLGEKKLQKIQHLPFTHPEMCFVLGEEGQKATFKSRERTQ